MPDNNQKKYAKENLGGKMRTVIPVLNFAIKIRTLLQTVFTYCVLQYRTVYLWRKT